MYTALDKLANLQCMQCLASSDREESVYKEHNLIVHSALLVLTRVRCSDKVWQYICLHTYAVHTRPCRLLCCLVQAATVRSQRCLARADSLSEIQHILGKEKLNFSSNVAALHRTASLYARISTFPCNDSLLTTCIFSCGTLSAVCAGPLTWRPRRRVSLG